MSIFTSLRQWFKHPAPRFAVPEIPGFTLPLPALGLWYSGIWPMGYTWKTTIYFTFASSAIAIFVLGEMLYLKKIWGDIGSMCGTLGTTIAGARILFNYFRLGWKREEFSDIIETFSAEIWISREVDEEVYLAAEKDTVFLNYVSVSIIGAILSKCILPYVSTMNLPPEEKRFPFAVDFPFPYKHPVTYHFMYLLGIHAGWACVLCMISHDSLLSYILIYTCARLGKLCQRIIDIGVENEEDDSVEEALAAAVEEHIRLIEFVDQVEDLFSPNILVQFVVTSLIFCVLGIEILLVDEALMTMIESVLFFITGLGQLFGICYAGQRLIDCSYQVGDAAYNFNWIDVNRKFHKNVIMIIQRSQSPLQITAYKFFSLSMESFSSICSTAGSYFALLKQLMEE